MLERLPDTPLSVETEKEPENESPDKKWYVIHTYAGYENRVETNLTPVSYTHLDVYKRQG